jgi:hypothetical protein
VSVDQDAAKVLVTWAKALLELSAAVCDEVNARADDQDDADVLEEKVAASDHILQRFLEILRKSDREAAALAASEEDCQSATTISCCESMVISEEDLQQKQKILSSGRKLNKAFAKKTSACRTLSEPAVVERKLKNCQKDALLRRVNSCVSESLSVSSGEQQSAPLSGRDEDRCKEVVTPWTTVMDAPKCSIFSVKRQQQAGLNLPDPSLHFVELPDDFNGNASCFTAPSPLTKSAFRPVMGKGCSRVMDMVQRFERLSEPRL